MLSRPLAIAVAVCAIALSPKLADACSCARSSLPCDEAGRADAVFVGHVVSIESSGMDGRVEFAIVEAFGGLYLAAVIDVEPYRVSGDTDLMERARAAAVRIDIPEGPAQTQVRVPVVRLRQFVRVLN